MSAGEDTFEFTLDPPDNIEQAIKLIERFPKFAPEMLYRLMSDLGVIGFNAARHIMVEENIKQSGSMWKNNRMRVERKGKLGADAIIGNAARSAKGYGYPLVVEKGILKDYTITPKKPGGVLSFYWAKLGKRVFLKSVTIRARPGKHVYRRAAERAAKEAPKVAGRILRAEGFK